MNEIQPRSGSNKRVQFGNINGERKLLLVVWIAAAGFIVLLTAAGWPEYWKHTAGETSPLAWFESVLLVLIASVAGLIGYLEGTTGATKRTVRGWLALAAGFAFLALDERFALHERIRDRLLKPTGVRLLPWMEAGDWVIPIYMIGGLAAVYGIWKLLGNGALARRYLVVALLLSVGAAGMDTIDVRSLNIDSERLLQSVEEGLETVAMTAFLSSFLCVLMRRIRLLNLAGPLGERGEQDQA